jgi:outer membrane translocation and assembly module TamA
MVNRLALDMALFYDAGTVASDLDRLTLGSFVSNYGIGARFHGPMTTPLRIEIAKGREGTKLVFAGRAAF